jgi:hypothetical protein
MTFEDFLSSLKEAEDPPRGLSLPLQALWYERKGNWEKAHQLVQESSSPEGAWVHAYLHRREGDQGNATYWYLRAGKPRSLRSLDQEWEEIARALLGS